MGLRRRLLSQASYKPDRFVPLCHHKYYNREEVDHLDLHPHCHDNCSDVEDDDHPDLHPQGNTEETYREDNIVLCDPYLTDEIFIMKLQPNDGLTFARVCNQVFGRWISPIPVPPVPPVLVCLDHGHEYPMELPSGMEQAHLVGASGEVACLATFDSYCLCVPCLMDGPFTFPKSSPANVEDEIWGITTYYENEDSSRYGAEEYLKRSLQRSLSLSSSSGVPYKTVIKIVRMFKSGVDRENQESGTNYCIELVTMMSGNSFQELRSIPQWRYITAKNSIPRLDCFGISATCEDEIMYIPSYGWRSPSLLKNMIAFNIAEEEFQEITLPDPPCEMPKYNISNRPMFIGDLYTKTHMLRLVPRRLPTSTGFAAFGDANIEYCSTWDAKVLTYEQSSP